MDIGDVRNTVMQTDQLRHPQVANEKHQRVLLE